MWNHVKRRRFSYCESPPRYYSYNNYEQMHSQSVYGRSYCSGPYYDYLYWRRNYQPYYSYSDGLYSRSYRLSNVPQSHNFMSSANKCYRDSTRERVQSSLSKNPVYRKSSESLISKDIHVNSKTSQSLPKSAASKHLYPTYFPVSSASLKINKESVNLHATETSATIVTESNPHALNVRISDCVRTQFSVTEPVNKFVPSGYGMSISRHDFKKKSNRDFSSCKAKSAEEKCNILAQSRSDKTLSSSNLRHYEANFAKSTYASHPTSRALNICEEDVNAQLSSKSDASQFHHPNMAPGSNFVKSECPEEQSVLMKTEEFFDYDYSDSNSISTVDVFVKCEDPTDPGDSEGHYLERQSCREPKQGDSLLLDASTLEKKLSDVVHLQLVSLLGTGHSKIVKRACISKENSEKTENWNSVSKSLNPDHKESSVSMPKDIQSTSPATTYENLSEKPDVKSELKNTNFLETGNKGLEPKYTSEGKNVKCLFTHREERGKVKREFKQQLVTDTTSTESEPVRDKRKILFSSDIKQNVNIEDERQHDFRQSRSCIMMDNVSDECPLGHFLIPADATFNIHTGRITVPCQSCNILVYMQSNIDFV